MMNVNFITQNSKRARLSIQMERQASMFGVFYFGYTNRSSLI